MESSPPSAYDMFQLFDTPLNMDNSTPFNSTFATPPGTSSQLGDGSPLSRSWQAQQPCLQLQPCVQLQSSIQPQPIAQLSSHSEYFSVPVMEPPAMQYAAQLPSPFTSSPRQDIHPPHSPCALYGSRLADTVTFESLGNLSPLDQPHDELRAPATPTQPRSPLPPASATHTPPPSAPRAKRHAPPSRHGFDPVSPCLRLASQPRITPARRATPAREQQRITSGARVVKGFRVVTSEKMGRLLASKGKSAQPRKTQEWLARRLKEVEGEGVE